MLFSLVAVATFIVAFIMQKKQDDDPDRKDRVAIVVFSGIALLMVAWLLDLFIPGFWIGA
jgi:hypothetical protein